MVSFITTALHCFGIASLVAGTPLPSYRPLVEHETTHTLPRGWTLLSVPADSELLSLRVALRQPHQDYLLIAQQVSDPSSPHYGRHLSATELQDALPDMTTTARDVELWLHSERAQNVRRDGNDWVAFTTSVGDARRLLGADFALYKHATAAEPVLRSRSYSIPSQLTGKIDFIYPTTQFLSPQSKPPSPLQPRRQSLEGYRPTCANHTCPALLKTKYAINYSPPNNASGSKIGIAGFLNQQADYQDVLNFTRTYGFRNDSTPYLFNVALVNGGVDNTTRRHGGIEAMLDTEYSMVFADPLPATFFSTGGRPPMLNPNGTFLVNVSHNEPYLEFFEYLLALHSPPQVITISYSDTEQTVPLYYAQRVCGLLAQLAARGVSVIGASGDGGASGTSDTACVNSKGQHAFEPTFPSSCPWFTSVGATASAGGAASFSSGGFSNYFARPAYQAAAVPAYFRALNGSHAAYYNASGRGIPDVALLGEDYLSVTSGRAGLHDGTSAGAPVFAAMIALLNDLRLRQGKPVLGFLNPLLYSSSFRAVFADVTSGQTIGCNVVGGYEPGFQALPGWDAATGLGEPNFAKMRFLVGY